MLLGILIYYYHAQYMYEDSKLSLWQEKWGAPTFCMKMLEISYNLGSIFKKNWFPIQKLKTCIVSVKLEYHCQLMSLS